jgi:hypothetical protein
VDPNSALDLAVFKPNIDNRTTLRRRIVNSDHGANLPAAMRA